MQFISNYHTHTALCGHATGMSADYIKVAIQKGLQEIGMSDHGPIPRSFMTPKEYVDNWLERQMDYQMFKEVYLPDVNQAIKDYSHLIKIRKGLEIEYIKGHDEYYQLLLQDVDYLLLGVHYFHTPSGFYNTYEPMDKTKALDYASTIEAALATGFFKVLVHPDLFLASYLSDNGIYEFDETALQVTKRIITSAIKNSVALEINAGGIRKQSVYKEGCLDFKYPRYDFWNVVKDFKDVCIVIGSDAHQPHEIADYSSEMAIDFANQFGLKITLNLTF
jgi:histidinol-phosphatase (PHP family)